MRDGSLEAAVVDCCTLLGCFVPFQEFWPILNTQLQLAADPAASAAVLAVLAAVTAGAGGSACGKQLLGMSSYQICIA